MKCDVCPFLNNFQRTITQTKYWKVDINENQEYLESSFKKTFDARLFNWSCLMNNAFKEKPANPHVHWHLRPRYEKEVKFAGITFIDPEFGHHYTKGSERILILSEDKLQMV